MFYNIDTEQFLSARQVAEMGIPAEQLHEHHIYPLSIERPEYDPATEGIEPDGPPVPAEGNPYAFVQHMRVYSILDRFRERKRNEAKMRRKEAQSRGIYIDGTLIQTDTDSQSRISVLAQHAQAGTLESVDFKAVHAWLNLSADQIIRLNQQISAHVQACFSRERMFVEGMDACTSLDALNEINLNEGWPAPQKLDAAGQAITEPQSQVPAAE